MKLSDVSGLGRALKSVVNEAEKKVTEVAKEVAGEVRADVAKVARSVSSGFETEEVSSAKGKRLGDSLPQVSSQAATVRAGSAGLAQQLHTNVGGKTTFDTPATAEAAVRNNPARTREWTMDQVRADPNGFLRNVVQIDGLNNTDTDRVSCGPTAMLMGMIAARPDSIHELGTKLMDPQGHITTEGRRLLGSNADAPVVQSAIRNLRDGRFSARDVTYLAESLQQGGSSSAQGLIALRSAITGIGVSVPRMELQQFGAVNGGQGHWRVNVNGTQYNPWPDAHGHSSQIHGAGQLASGASDGPGWVNREKLYIDDNSAVHNVYNISAGSQHWEVTNDPPLFITRYERQADGSSRRANVDATRIQQMTNNGVSQGDINSCFPPSIPSR